MTAMTPQAAGPRRPTIQTRLAGLGLVAVLAATLAGCGGGGSAKGTTAGPGAAATPSSHNGHDAAGISFSPPEPGSCSMKMPGELMTAAEATVSVSPTSVCPSYVTVAPGTAITFANVGPARATIVVHRGMPAHVANVYADASTTAPAPAVVATADVEPAGSAANTIDAPGTYYFTFDQIPTFIGTIEVRAGG